MKNLVLALAVMLSFGACAADDGISIPNCDSDVKIVVDRINRIEGRQERESNCRTYLDLAEKLVKRAKEHDIPLKRSKYFVLARGCFEVVKRCDYDGMAAAAPKAGMEAEGYRSPEDIKAIAENGIDSCNAGLSGQLRLPGIEPDESAERIAAELRERPDNARREASGRYLEAARYYEKLSRDSAGPDCAEYGAAAMSCYLIVSEIAPDARVSNEAWAGYKRCGAYTASYCPGRAM